LADDRIRERMHVLQAAGYEFTVFSVGMPTPRVSETLADHYAFVATWEVIAPRHQLPHVIHGTQQIKQKVGVRVYLSTIDALADQHRDESAPFSHFPDHGFRLEEQDLLSTCITRHGAGEVIDGFVFCSNPDTAPWQSVQSVRQIITDLGVAAAVHMQLPRKDEGIIYADDRETSNRVAETLVAALTADDTEVFLDTFVDHDRGYYPRNGLLDRRYNPRSSFYVLRHLHCALGNSQHELGVIPINSSVGIRAFALQTPQYRCVLLLSNEEASRVELDLSRFPGVSAYDGTGQWLNLRTGKIEPIHWKQSPSNDGWIGFEGLSAPFDPALLILSRCS
jgi:hypothetical protein